MNHNSTRQDFEQSNVAPPHADTCGMEKFDSHRGFTLVELVVAVAIFGLLIGIGLPSFSSAIANSRISAQYNDTIGAFFLARSEAVKSSANVTVCARKKDQSQSCKQSGGDWSHGLVVFQDNPPIAQDGDIVIGTNDTVLHVEPELKAENTLTAYGSTNNTADQADPRSYVVYSPNGSTNWRGASLVLCDERGPSMARAMNIVITGDIRRGRTTNTGTVPLDTFGLKAECP